MHCSVEAMFCSAWVMCCSALAMPCFIYRYDILKTPYLQLFPVSLMLEAHEVALPALSSSPVLVKPLPKVNGPQASEGPVWCPCQYREPNTNPALMPIFCLTCMSSSSRSDTNLALILGSSPVTMWSSGPASLPAPLQIQSQALCRTLLQSQSHTPSQLRCSVKHYHIITLQYQKNLLWMVELLSWPIPLGTVSNISFGTFILTILLFSCIICPRFFLILFLT